MKIAMYIELFLRWRNNNDADENRENAAHFDRHR